MILQAQNSSESILVITALLGLLGLGLMIWFLINLQSAMNAVSRNNRSMDGGLVWLNLIPIFNFIWPFIFNSNLKSSYKKEFRALRIDEEVRLGAGIVYPILQLIMIVLPIVISTLYAARGGYDDLRGLEDLLLLINAIYVLFGLGTFISMMVFWSQANTHKYLLKQHQDSASMNYANNGQNSSGQNYGGYAPPMPPVYPTHYNSSHQSPPVPVQSYQAPLPPPVPPQTTSSSDNSFENRVPLNQNSEEQTNTTSNQVKKEETPVEKLKKYHDLLSSGLITQADFDAIKKELLNIK
jgi:hypothetical protein